MAHREVDAGKAEGEDAVATKASRKDKDKLVFAMKTMLGSAESELVEASSICEVPKQLRKWKEEAYKPKVVSTGPLHYRARKELLYMEEIKLRCMLFLLHCRETGDLNEDERLKECSKAIYDLDEVFRACYADDIKYNQYDLAKILLVDACFLLELLVSNHEEVHKESHPRSPGAEVGKKEQVLSDLIVLENQIPLIVLYKLCQTLFEPYYDDALKFVNERVLSLFGYSSTQNSSNSAHILELIHSHLTTGNYQIDQTSNRVSIRVDRNLKTKPKPKRCAAWLIASGITIKPLCREPGARIQLGCDFNFDNGELEIQPLSIRETTVVMWRNFIAWEHSRTTHEKFCAMEQGTRRTICKFSQYALLFGGLICCEHDIQLLIDQKVLLVDAESSNDHDRKKKKNIMSNKDLVTMFSKITEELEDVEMDMDSGLGQLFEDLDLRCSTVTCAKKGTGLIMWHYIMRYLTAFWYFCRNWFNIKVFRRDYCPTGWKLIAWILGIVLYVTTLISMFLSIFQFIHPVNSRSSVLSSKGLVFPFVD